uniref:pseudouridine synthase n=1 Tax=Sphingomonas bacterium TaxID=1895847 RepID=UPI0020C6D7DE
MSTDRSAIAASGRGPGERIAKLLARAGIASRREVERMIAEGRVALDGTPIDTPATLLTSLAGITVDGKAVAAPAAARLFVYHKPPGLLVTERDPAGRPTIYDRLPPELPRVVPVGRLDLATEGLLLLTTDGGLKRQLELPATGVERTYRARAYGPVTQAQLEELIHGVEIEGMRYGPIDANLERRTGANGWIEMTLTEGKNREVRRVLEHLGLEVSRLIRTRYGPFVLGDMGPGDVGEVRQHELEVFRKTLKTGKSGDQAAIMALPLAPAPAAAPPAVPPADRSRARTAGSMGERRAVDAMRPTGARRPPSPAAQQAIGERGGDRSGRARPSPTARPAKPVGTRDDQPQAFGERTRAKTSAHPRDGRPAERPVRTRPDRRDGEDRAKPPQRPARAGASPGRAAAPRDDRSPSADRSRG